MKYFNLDVFLKKNKIKSKDIHAIGQLFGLPTRFGIYLGFAIIGGIGLSSRLENNFLLLILLFQMVIFFLSIIWSAKNLIGLGVEIKKNFIFIPSVNKSVPIIIKKDKRIYDLKIQNESINLDKQKIYQDYEFFKRGKNKIKDLKVSSCFPFNIVCCWTWINPGPLTVAPYPINLNSIADIDSFINLTNLNKENDVFDHYRNSIDQDSPKIIDWKKYLHQGIKVTKVGSKANNQDFISIDGDRLIKVTKERGLQLICGILLFCKKRNISWRLSLNYKEFKSSKNEIYQAFKYIALV